MSEIIARRLTLVMFVLLMGCGPSYSDVLEQKIAGKSPAAQRTLLAEECAAQIRAGLIRRPEPVTRFDDYRQVCEEMTGVAVR